MNLALWHVAPDRSELRPVEPPGGDRVAVRSRWSLVSCGTERVVARGGVPAPAAGAMAVPYMEGAFPFPVKYGYSLVGEDPEGRPVHGMHPHQQTAYLSSADLFELPPDLPLRRAALISNSETALNAIWDAELEPGGEAVVCGFGGIGALLAVTLRVGFAVDPLVVEIDPWRRARAAEFGFESRDPADDVDDAAVAFNATGDGRGLQWCIDHGGMEARIVDLGWYGDRVSELRLGDRFHYLRHRIVSSQVSTVAPSVRATTTRAGRKRRVVELLRDTAYDALLDREVDFADTPGLFDALRGDNPGNGLNWLVRYGEG